MESVVKKEVKIEVIGQEVPELAGADVISSHGWLTDSAAFFLTVRTDRFFEKMLVLIACGECPSIGVKKPKWFLGDAKVVEVSSKGLIFHLRDLYEEEIGIKKEIRKYLPELLKRMDPKRVGEARLES